MLVILGATDSGKTLYLQDLYSNRLKYENERVFILTDKEEEKEGFVLRDCDEFITDYSLIDLKQNEKVHIVIDNGDKHKKYIESMLNNKDILMTITYEKETEDNKEILNKVCHSVRLSTP